jgi:hypothetical protein
MTFEAAVEAILDGRMPRGEFTVEQWRILKRLAEELWSTS